MCIVSALKPKNDPPTQELSAVACAMRMRHPAHPASGIGHCTTSGPDSGLRSRGAATPSVSRVPPAARSSLPASRPSTPICALSAPTPICALAPWPMASPPAKRQSCPCHPQRCRHPRPCWKPTPAARGHVAKQRASAESCTACQRRTMHSAAHTPSLPHQASIQDRTPSSDDCVAFV